MVKASITSSFFLRFCRSQVFQKGMALHNRMGHIDEHAAACAFLLDPKDRPENGTDGARQYLFDHAVPFLLHRRFGDTSTWSADRLNEAKAFLTLKLQSQLNLWLGSE